MPCLRQSACYFDGKYSSKYFIGDYNSSDEILQKCILSMCSSLSYKYNKYKVYIHNLANFDGIFLLRTLAKIGQVNVVINEGRIINIDLGYKDPKWKNPVVISFRDSYQIFPASLRKLAKCFNVDTLKTIFPYNFLNDPSTTLQYGGIVPGKKYFYNISVSEYNKYASNFNNNWSLKTETLKYCINDCISLYQVLIKFNELYFNMFKININEHPTLSSHAMRLYRTHFMKDTEIPMIYGNVHVVLRTSYTGGAVDMYIPKNENIEMVSGYDVNSLYPTVRENSPMPVGKKIFFQGDITKFF